MTAWRDVEVAAAEQLDGPTEADLQAIRTATFTVDAVKEREQVTDHDVAAFVDVLGASAGAAGRWIHFGLTSSDVLDTALGLQLRRAGDVVLPGARAFAEALAARAREHAGDALRRPHARRPRRADLVRAQARRLRLRGATATPTGWSARSRRPRSARSPAPSARTRRSGRTTSAACSRRSGSRRRTSRPRSCRATATRSCSRRSRSRAPGWSGSRPRSATCSAPRCARSRSRSAPARRARARCPTSATRS